MISSLCVVALVILKCLQLPRPSFSQEKLPPTYYEAIVKSNLSHLFSKKTINLDGIKIQGILLTGETKNGAQGYVVFEIDGKNVGPIAVGESFGGSSGSGGSLGQGIYLQSITPDSVTVSYQGQQTQLNLFKKAP